MVTRSHLHIMVPTLLSPQTTLSLLCAIGGLSWFKTLILEKL